MKFDVDTEYGRMISSETSRRIPILRDRTPSLYSEDGKHLYLKTLDIIVGREENDLPMLESTFWNMRDHPQDMGDFLPKSNKLKKEYELRLDKELLAEWIKTHFADEIDAELGRGLSKVISGN